MFLQSDITYKQVDAPPNRYCYCGHFASLKFKKDNYSEEQDNRFFSISGNGINGIYCEFCLTIASMLAKQNKINI
jgi:DNA modification methylase